MQVSFDIDDLLAYLLTGSLMLVSLGQLFPVSVGSIISVGIFGKGTSASATGIVVVAAIILLLGHFSSVVTRYVTRIIVRKIFGNPREYPFLSRNNKFWNEELKTIIQQNFKNSFGYTVSEEESIAAAPRMVRSYVLNKYPATREIRDRIVRARSLCGNSLLPVFLFAISALKNGNYSISISLIVLGIALLWKQSDLDVREWKEIYTMFAIKKTAKSNN